LENMVQTPEGLLTRISKRDDGIILVLNKIDKCSKTEIEVAIKQWESMKGVSQVIPISALKEDNTDVLLETIIDALPEFEPYFPKDEISDRSERFFVSEILREKVLKLYKKEIPYATEVVIEEFKDEAKICRIRAIIYVERESQKGIIIGHKGGAIKKLGTYAREDMEKFLGKKVFLEQFVKVAKDWRKSAKELKRFGY